MHLLREEDEGRCRHALGVATNVCCGHLKSDRERGDVGSDLRCVSDR